MLDSQLLLHRKLAALRPLHRTFGLRCTSSHGRTDRILSTKYKQAQVSPSNLIVPLNSCFEVHQSQIRLTDSRAKKSDDVR